MMDRRSSLALLFLAGSALAVTGCLGAPEHCRGCLVALADAGPQIPPKDAGTGTGGGIVGTGGRIGTGGTGAIGTGGTIATGGNVGTGGSGTGGAASGGAGTGGASTGGSGTGGTATGGRASGGASTGGSSTGGASTGGSSTGGASTGGSSTGGASTGGRGTGGASTGGSGTGGAVDPDLVLWYKFDETSGTAMDSSGNGRNGTPTGIGSGGVATYSTSTNRVPPGSLNLTSASATVGGYVVVPSGLNAMGATTAITIAAWVNVRTARAWQRIFDFGSGSSATSPYAFLTTQQNSTSPQCPRFAISTTGNTNEQIINMSTPAALSSGWHHMAVVLGTGATYTGTLYIDKAVAGTNNAMTIRPSALGATTNNWIGRSQYMTADPLFDGYIDDFRIYKRALTAAEITALP